LVVSGFLEASCGEPTDTAGENVTATKHGFESSRLFPKALSSLVGEGSLLNLRPQAEIS